MKQLAHKILVLCMIAVLGCSIYFVDGNKSAQAASGGKIYITPLAANYTVGQEFNALVRVSSPSPINAAFVHLYYNGRGLQVMSIQRGADFPNQNVPTKHTAGAEGKIYMESTRNATTAGNFHFATIRFKATAAGSWGFRPGTESWIINYPKNTVSFTVGRADFVVSNPPVVAPQPTNPTPTPTPTPRPSTPAPSNPTPSDPGEPSDGSSESTPEDPEESPVSDSGLQLTDFTITNLRYRGALLSWNTTKPSPSKVNFGTDPDDLSSEQLSTEAKTEHTMELDAEKLRAGTTYYIRATADDGNGPVTVDSEFTTKPIAVIVKVTDKDEKPVAGATITVGENIQETDENGETTMDLPEGDVTIFAQKDELSQEIGATITLPESDDAPVQRISLALTEKSAAPKITTPPSKKKLSAALLIIPLLLLTGGFVAFIIWRKKRQSTYYSDPLEAENYTAPVLPSTPVPLPADTNPANNTTPEYPALPEQPEPQYQPLENPALEHHTTLPELVGRYGAPPVGSAEQDTIQTEAISPAGQHIPKHTSLKDLVSVPQNDIAAEPELPEIDTSELPESPVSFEDEPISTSADSETESNNDGALTIKH